MKVLYAVQATGNGHISRALEIIPILKNKTDVDILVSGTQGDLNLPFDIKYRCHGLSFYFGQKGGIDYRKTYQNFKHKKLIQEIRELPVKDYDLVISDFEPVASWAAKLKGVHCVGMSHQAALLSDHIPRPATYDLLHNLVLSQYSPADELIGFHFQRYDVNIFTPVINKALRRMEPADKGHYTVYLPAYHHYKIVSLLSEFPSIRWEIFSKHADRESRYSNILVRPVSKNAFQQSIASCSGVICGAGFETPGEALFLGKKLLVVPMKGQFEQMYNAAALRGMGIPVIRNIRKSQAPRIEEWLSGNNRVPVDYPDETSQIIDMVLEGSKVNLVEV